MRPSVNDNAGPENILCLDQLGFTNLDLTNSNFQVGLDFRRRLDASTKI